MTVTSKAQLRDDLHRRYGRDRAAVMSPQEMHDKAVKMGANCPGMGKQKAGDVAWERAFVLHAESGRTVITAPVREIASNNPAFTLLSGRLVGADEPNRNGALWTSEDLQMGEGSVAGGPLNWLHDDTKNIGCLLDGRMTAATDDVPAHIATNAAVWSFLFANETKVIASAARAGDLYYSMECVSREVSCVGDNGCGESFSYADYEAKRTCAHLRERSSTRRFVDPLFLGAAVIVPPVSPGWAQANVELARQAAAAAETIHEDHLTKQQAQDLAAQILSWANR